MSDAAPLSTLGRESWRVRKAQESMLFATVERVLRNPLGLLAVCGLLIILMATLGAGLLSQYSPTDQAYRGAARYLAPSLDHPFGTDNVRRDMFSRTLFGLRNSLAVSLAAVIFGSSLVGAPVSTTQVVASSVVGVGIGRHRFRHVRWRIVREMGLAWVTTLPASALLAILVLPLWRWLA